MGVRIKERTPTEDERRSVRVDLEIPVQFRGRGGSGTGLTKNICANGVFVATLRSLPVGARLVVRLSLPGDAGPVEFLAEVRWSRPFQELDDRSAGFGLRFVDTPVGASIFAMSGATRAAKA
jgi:uncharacterized protein (TIGR02266 family)